MTAQPNSTTVKAIYSGKVAERYDISMSHFFARLKQKALTSSKVRAGDNVVVFCCGSGLDFHSIQQIIGPKGKIIGVDFSEKMLQQAKNRVRKAGWTNVELFQSDVTTFNHQLPIPIDAGLCTLGLSIIPEHLKAYDNLLANVRNGGTIVIGDMKLAEGWMAHLNPLIIKMAKRYGGSFRGHQNSNELIFKMHQDLKDVSVKSYFFDGYYYATGVKP